MNSINRQEIIGYIENRHQADGGYFFARVEPSSGLDTYLAVKTLRLLDVKTKNAKSIASFWKQENLEGNLDSLFAVFLAVETYKELGLSVKPFKKYQSSLIGQKEKVFSRAQSLHAGKNQKISLTHAMDFIGARGKDLQDLFYLAILSRDLGFGVDKKKIADFVYSLQNKDGGFGHKNESHLIATYHALNILDVLSLPIKDKDKILVFLVHWFDRSDYLEDLFYSVESLSLLSEPIPDVEETVQFANSCRRNNGGFSRAQVMGIPTIEYTYMAVSILKDCEKYAGKKILK
jgi:hypothetical protein